MTYFEHKSNRQVTVPTEGKTICTKLCKFAIETMESILKTSSEISNNSSDYLLNIPSKYQPISVKRYNDLFKKILIQYCGHLLKHKEEGTNKVVCGKQTYYLPQPKQFRVCFATSLYEQGISLAVVEKLLGHISGIELEGYYIRTRNAEQLAATSNIVQDLLHNRYNLLGGIKANSLQKQIVEISDTKIIKPSEIKIQKNIDELFNLLKEKNIVIRSKSGGYCIRDYSSLSCPKEKITDKLLCVSGICPNYYHFFYNIISSYSDFLKVKELYLSLLNKGYIRAADCEYNKIIEMCKRRLMPELSELKKEIKNRGREEIISTHPAIEDIVNNLSNIDKEVKSWIQNHKG